MDDGFYTKKPARHTDFARPAILLHPNIPKPLHGLAPREILGKAWWDTTRKEAYKRQHYHCAACGIPKEEARYHQWLEAHETYDIDYPLGRSTYVETVALCHSCHNYIHSGRLKILAERGEISHDKRIDILHHGAALLVKAGLKPRRYTGKCARWSEWRLVLNGVEYKPKFKSFKAWAKHYGHEEEKEEAYFRPFGSILDEDWLSPEMEEH